MYTWHLAILVLWATYSGNLVAFLTVIKNPVPINTLKELADQDQYKFGLLGGTAWVTSFEVSAGGFGLSIVHYKKNICCSTNRDINIIASAHSIRGV